MIKENLALSNIFSKEFLIPVPMSTLTVLPDKDAAVTFTLRQPETRKQLHGLFRIGIVYYTGKKEKAQRDAGWGVSNADQEPGEQKRSLTEERG